MVQFSINPEEASVQVNKEKGYEKELAEIGRGVRSIKKNLRFEILSESSIQSRLDNVVSELERQAAGMKSMHTVLQNVVETYEDTEKRILQNAGVKENKKTDVSSVIKLVGSFGVIGKAASVGLKIASSEPSFKNMADVAKTGHSFIKKVKDLKPKTVTEWKEALFDTNVPELLKEAVGTGAAVTLKGGIEVGWKGFQKELNKKLSDKVGIGLSLVANGISNYEEMKRGEISAERAVAETVLETAVDVGKAAVVKGAVLAGAALLGVSAPMWAVGAATVAIGVGADWVSAKLTGKKLTEAVSDGILDMGYEASLWFQDNIGIGTRLKKQTLTLWKRGLGMASDMVSYA